jgi:hypothetical protein
MTSEYWMVRYGTPGQEVYLAVGVWDVGSLHADMVGDAHVWPGYWTAQRLSARRFETLREARSARRSWATEIDCEPSTGDLVDFHGGKGETFEDACEFWEEP